MGIFQKVSGWLNDKSDRFIRGGADQNGYYAGQEARGAYANRAEEEEPAQEPGEATGRREAIDPFGRGEGEYGGRVPYRSKYDLEMEAYQQQQAAYQQQQQQQAAERRENAAPQAQAQSAPMQQPQPSRQPQQPNYAQGYAPVNNVVMFPGMQRDANGLTYTHVEYVVLLRSRNECKDVIGYIKTNASVFLNMEFIASDSERQRCVDMLSGAAYTLGCALNKISPRGIYLISAPTVKVILDPSIQNASSPQDGQGYANRRYSRQEGYGYAQAAQTAQSGYAQAGQAQPAATEANYQAAGSYTARQPRQANGYDAPQQSSPPPRSFSNESPTARFFAQGTQRSRPVNMASAVAGNFTGNYAATGTAGQNSGRYRATDYSQ